jgi:hypothetical protein
MSYRRTVSFAKNEKDLLEYFDSNGKSDIVKDAIKFYKENKEKPLTDAMKLEILKLIEKIDVKPSNVTEHKTNEAIRHKLSKLIK